MPLGVCKTVKAQQDDRLLERLEIILKATEKMDIEKILDLSYPKLFTIAPRKAIKEALIGSFETEEFTTTLDSVRIDTVFPVFFIKESQYAKIIHKIVMHMKFKEIMDSTDVEIMLPLMKEAFDNANVWFDQLNNTIVISGSSVMVAIKDDFAKEWCFVNYDDKGDMVNLLFSNEVIEKLKEYK